jgi:hypothetical protein
MTLRVTCAIAALALAVSGCTITRVTSSPGATGRVVDSTTGAAIEGARVIPYTGFRVAALTSVDGRFSIRSTSGFRLQPLIPPVVVGTMMATGKVDVIAIGYATRRILVSCSRGEREPVDLQTIELHKIQP